MNYLAVCCEVVRLAPGVRSNKVILLKNPMNASTRLSMSGKSAMILHVLRSS